MVGWKLADYFFRHETDLESCELFEDLKDLMKQAHDSAIVNL